MLTPALRPAQIDFSKVVARIDDVRVWVEAKLKDTLGVEDDVVEEMVMGLLQEGGKQGPDPKVMQVSLSGFLEKNAKRFMRDLWKYLKDVAEGKTAAAAPVRGLPGPAAGAGAWGVPQLGAPVAAMGQTSVGVPPAAPALGMVPPPPARGPVQVAPPPPPPPPVQPLAPGAKPKRRRWDVEAPAVAAEGAACAATLAASQAGTGSAEDAARAAALAAARGHAANVGTAEQQRERQQRGGEHAGAGSQALDDEGGGGPREGEVGGERGARFPSSLPLPPPPPISPSAKRSRWA